MINYDNNENIPIRDSLTRLAEQLAPSGFAINWHGVTISHSQFNMIAGPCTISSKEELENIAVALQQTGVKMLRGGTFKLRTHPQAFRGLGAEGVTILHEIARRNNMLSVSEVTALDQIDIMADAVDILLIGTRNMHNYPLLEWLGKLNQPVILKRGMSSTIEEWLLAAAHIIDAGNPNVILCERGIRTFEPATRNTFDVSAIALLRQICHLPIIGDPSHGTGRRTLVRPVALAAVAAGADGLIIEVHNKPDMAVCDAAQTIDMREFELLQQQLAAFHL